MSAVEDFIRSEIEGKILKILKEIEELHEEIVEDWSSKIGVSKPNIVVTLEEVNECSSPYVCIQDSDNYCKVITGDYIPDTKTIVLYYRSNIDSLLHLFLHHVYASQIGFDKYRQIKYIETIRLPWSLRPTEIRILAMTKKMYNVLVTQRTGKIWTDYIKTRIRMLDEEIQKVSSTVRSFASSVMPSVHMRQLAYKVSREDKT